MCRCILNQILYWAPRQGLLHVGLDYMYRKLLIDDRVSCDFTVAALRFNCCVWVILTAKKIKATPEFQIQWMKSCMHVRAKQNRTVYFSLMSIFFFNAGIFAEFTGAIYWLSSSPNCWPRVLMRICACVRVCGWVVGEEERQRKAM